MMATSCSFRNLHKYTGIEMSYSMAPERLPVGVIAFTGWANRLLIKSYCLWVPWP